MAGPLDRTEKGAHATGKYGATQEKGAIATGNPLLHSPLGPRIHPAYLPSGPMAQRAILMAGPCAASNIAAEQRQLLAARLAIYGRLEGSGNDRSYRSSRSL